MSNTSLCKRVALSFAFCAASWHAAAAQTPPKPRPFDRVPGILVACAPARSVSWTERLCPYIIAEVKRRAVAAKLPVAVVESTPDMASRKFGMFESFDGDKAVRMHWICTEDERVKRRVEVALKSNVMYEPTQSDFPNIPNILPGQRLHRPFLSMPVTFDPRATTTDHQKNVGLILDAFFEVGEGKHSR